MNSYLTLLLNLWPLVAASTGILMIIIGIPVYLYVKAKEDRECPRMIMGYNHKNEGCDHSEIRITEAKFNMKRNKTRLMRGGK